MLGIYRRHGLWGLSIAQAQLFCSTTTQRSRPYIGLRAKHRIKPKRRNGSLFLVQIDDYLYGIAAVRRCCPSVIFTACLYTRNAPALYNAYWQVRLRETFPPQISRLRSENTAGFCSKLFLRCYPWLFTHIPMCIMWVIMTFLALWCHGVLNVNETVYDR